MPGSLPVPPPHHPMLEGLGDLEGGPSCFNAAEGCQRMPLAWHQAPSKKRPLFPNPISKPRPQRRSGTLAVLSVAGTIRPSGLPERGTAPRASGLPRPDGVCERRQVPAERCPARPAQKLPPQPALPNPRHMLRSALHLPMGSHRAPLAWHRREGRRKSGSPIWKEFSG